VSLSDIIGLFLFHLKHTSIIELKLIKLNNYYDNSLIIGLLFNYAYPKVEIISLNYK
jgi:hypothetical protein